MYKLRQIIPPILIFIALLSVSVHSMAEMGKEGTKAAQAKKRK